MPQLPQLVLERHAHGVQLEQVEWLTDLDQRQVLHTSAGEERGVVAHDHVGDQGRRPFDDVEPDGHLLFVELHDRGVDLGLAETVLVVEDADAQDIPLELRSVEIVPLLERTPLAEPADWREDRAGAARRRGGDVRLDVLGVDALDAVQLETPHLGSRGDVFACQLRV